MSDLESNLNMYREIHVNPKRFLGYSLKRNLEEIKQIVEKHKPKSLLDYGCGKGYQYLNRRYHEYWGGLLPHCYDPGVVGLNAKPEGSFDGVLCTDVLEHVPEECIVEVLIDIFKYANKFVYLCICTRLARKTLPDGRNCHLTVKDEGWWEGILEGVSSSYSDISLYVKYTHE